MRGIFTNIIHLLDMDFLLFTDRFDNPLRRILNYIYDRTEKNITNNDFLSSRQILFLFCFNL